jgi:hypothetical protein
MLKKYHEREVPVQDSFELTTTSAVWQDDNKLVHFYYIVQQQQHDDAYRKPDNKFLRR